MALQNAFGNLGLDETLQRIAIYLEQLASTVGRAYPDTTGRLPVNIAGSVSTVTTLSNQNQQSGYSTAYDQYAQIQMCATAIRSNIVVS